MKATKLSISFYPAHLEVIDHYAQTLGLRGNNVRSPTLQQIVSEWAEVRGYSLVASPSGRPLHHQLHSYLLPIGYLHLNNLIDALDPTQPVYVAPHTEAIQGVAPRQHTDHHFVMVMQPDEQNRVHYCRIPVVRLVYHNGIAFAPDYAEQLAKVYSVLEEVTERLGGERYKVRKGMVAFPLNLQLIEAIEE